MKRIAIISMIGAAAVTAAAYTINGVIYDTLGEPLPAASLRLLAGNDSTVVKGVVADANGVFSFPNINRGKYIVEASYVGYNTNYINVDLHSSVTLDTIKMVESSVMLHETTVYGIKTPITVKEDTIEFNADSYRTAPNAVVEDLLKRLPGVEVSSDGTITANGQQVTKILIDGKEFFSDDPTVASRNLPVNMVDRLQVVNRKSDLARITGVDDGEDETVINLTVKKGMQNGWFGTIEGGYGSNDRYRGQFNVNHFWDGNQVTFIGAINNVNDLSFNDGTASRFRRFGATSGVTTSQALGVNFNVGNGEIFRIGGDVMYSRSDRDTRQRTARQYLLESNTPFSNTGKMARDIGNNIRADFRIQWKPDSLNTLDFRPNFSYNHSNSWSNDSSLTSMMEDGSQPITRSRNIQGAHGDSYEFGGRLIYNHQFASHRGRSMSLFVNYRYSNVQERSTNYSWNQFYQYNDSIDLYDQFETNNTLTNNISARLSWTEPLGDPSKGNFLTVAYRFQYRWNNADKLVYDHPVSFPEGWGGPAIVDPDLVFSEDLSNQYRNEYMNQDIRLGYKHVARKSSVDVGISLVPQKSTSIDLLNSARNISRSVFNFAPYLRYRWKASKTKGMNLDYMGRSSQPTIAQLQPVVDRSNPLNIVVGNPALKPSFTHNIRLRFNDFNADAQRSIMTMFDARVVQNSIISMTQYDTSTGGQTTTYTNVNGVWNVRAMNMVSFPFRNKHWTFNNHLMLYVSNTIGYNNGLRNRSTSFSVDLMPGVAFRPDNFEFELRPRYNLQNVHNTVQVTGNRTVHSYGGEMYLSYTTPIGVILNSDLGYTATSGYSQGYDESRWTWNAEISYQFLRNRQLTLSLKAYDILGQQADIRRSVTANYIDDSETNALGRYVMVTLAYKFNTFGAGNIPQSRNDYGGPPAPPAGAPRPPRRM